MRYLLLLLICIPCFSRDNTIIISKKVPKEISAEVVRSVVSLNKALNEVKFTFVDGLLNYKIYIDFSLDLKDNIAGEARRGVFYCLITIFPPSYNVFKTTVWHEIGHCKGLDHKGVHGNVMSEKVDPFYSYPDEKIQEFLQDLKKVMK
jgi:hypothetical protein